MRGQLIHILLLNLLLCLSVHAFAQCDSCGENLVPNGDFELFDPNLCANLILPELYSDISPVDNWIGASTSFGPSLAFTPDYFNPLCNLAFPAAGVDQSAAIGFFTITIPGDPASEWIQVQLNEPLIQGEEYCISFSAFTPEELSTASDGLDIVLLDAPINQSPDGDGDNPTFFVPAYSNPPGQFLPSELTAFSFSYCAEGGEEWLALGNQNADQTITETPMSTAYVIVDNVSVSQSCASDDISFDLETNDPAIECGECAEILVNFNDGESGEIIWEPEVIQNNGLIQVCPLETTTYTATLVSQDCSGLQQEISSQSITINVDCDDPLSVDIDDVSICSGETVTIEAMVSGGFSPYNYVWSTGDEGANSIEVSPAETTNYSLVVTDDNGDSEQQEFTIVVDQEITDFELEEVVVLCPSASINLDPNLGVEASYLWSDGSTGSTLEVSSAGEYSVVVTNACSSQSDTTVVIDVLAELDYNNLLTGCEGVSQWVGFQNADEFDILWSNGQTADSILVDQAGVYLAQVLLPECPNSLDIPFNVSFENCDCDFYIPNAFTPNNDGLNDVFEVQLFCEVSFYELSIYNRWGEKVFESLSPSDWWNGSFENGSYYTEDGVYNYLLRLSSDAFSNPSDIKVIQGHVTLIR
jgi:gliding motility-associated-like protein